MKQLDNNLFQQSEKFSNHAVVAFEYPNCPIDFCCFAIATGFGGLMRKCDNLEFGENEEVAFCKKL